MSRYFGVDVINDIKAKLVSDLNTNITTINTARAMTTGLIKKFAVGWGGNQFPVCYIMLGNSVLGDNENELNNNIEYEVENYDLEITVEHKTNKVSETIKLEMEVYAEAIEKTLHGFNNTGIVWTIVTGREPFTVPTRENHTFETMTIFLQVKVM